MDEKSLPISDLCLEYQKMRSVENTAIVIAGMSMATALCVLSNDAIAPVIALIGGIVGLVAKSIYDSRNSA